MMKVGVINGGSSGLFFFDFGQNHLVNNYNIMITSHSLIQLQFTFLLMKHMTCMNHKQANQVCINSQCKQTCAYICMEPNCSCRINHEPCQVASLPFLIRKSAKAVTKTQELQIQKLINLAKNAKKAVESIQLFLQSYHLLTAIKSIIDPHGLLQPNQKQTISNYLNSKSKQQNQVSLIVLQKQLTVIQYQVNTYLQIVKAQKQKQQQIKSKKQSNGKSAIRSKIMQPSPVKSGLRQSKDFQKQKNIFDSQVQFSKLRSKVQSSVKEASPNSKINSSPAKRHIPKPPLFSKITNDIQTINTFFYYKFSQIKLLYRASENDFLVSKFHEKCDGVQNTLTLIQTEGQRIIGGFTPLPWKSAGGEWSSDDAGATFLFSLTTGQRFPLINKEKAIWCSQAFGPSFGHPDLEICDKAHASSKSCANFPKCFNNGNYSLNSSTTQIFCGNASGNFKIRQWEVYMLSF